MLSAADSPLVAGASRAQPIMANIRIIALRGFRGMVSGTLRTVEKGETVDVPLLHGQELISTGKAKAAPAELIQPNEASRASPAPAAPAQKGSQKNQPKESADARE